MALGQPAQGGNGADTSGAVHSGGRLSQVVGDIAKYFKSPTELSNIQGQSQPPQQGGQQYQQQPPQQGQQQQGQQGQQEQQQQEDPLEVYKGLFSNEPKLDKDGKPITPAEPPAFKLDAKTIGDAAGRIDFMSNLPKELADKLQSGTMDAGVLSEVVQHTGRQAYARAMEHATTLTDRFVTMRLAHEQQGLPGQVKRLLAQTQVLSNPAIQKNPALREHYEYITGRLSDKFPDQSADWIASQANQYFTDMAKAVNPNLGEQKQSQAQDAKLAKEGATVDDSGKVFDWQAYLK